MQPIPPNTVPARQAPSFGVLEQAPPRPVAWLLAWIVAAAVIYSVGQGLAHSRQRHFREQAEQASRTPGGDTSSSSATPDGKDDDPSQVDTIVLGDAADAPVPARRNHHISNVHATVIIHLPRFGPNEGLIPDSPAGHLLYNWLAAFNQGSDAALTTALPNAAPNATAAAEMLLRLRTGGLRLLSAREIQPGILVFRMRDQTPEAEEILGTLQVRPGSSPPTIGTFSLRAVEPPPPAKTDHPLS